MTKIVKEFTNEYRLIAYKNAVAKNNPKAAFSWGRKIGEPNVFVLEIYKKN